MQPTISYDENKGYTMTLWRDGNKIVHEFKNFSVSIDENNETVINGFSSVAIHGIHEQLTIPEDHTRIGGPPCNGVFYYICAVPYRGEDRMIWLSKEEYDILLPMLDEIQEERFYDEREIEFTRTTINDCMKNPQNYGPEMRARIMMSSCPECDKGLAGSVYRPRCSECTWDSQEGYESDDCHDAYREHPLDHE